MERKSLRFQSALVASMVGIFLFTSAAWSALKIPPPPETFIHDQADMLSPGMEGRLYSLIKRFELETSNQILVATFPSLEGESLEDFSIRLAEAWKPGQKERHNGVIFLIFRDDRKMRIEVGYGLEGVLPDALAGQIIREVVAPLFREESYEEGISAGVDAIMKATMGEFKGKGLETVYGAEELDRLGKEMGRVLTYLFLLFLAMDLFRYGGYRHLHRLYVERYSFLEWWIRFGILFALLSIPFRVFWYSFLYGQGGYYGSRTGFGSYGRGRVRYGGGLGGYGGLGGGFSGGGGRFGGGGASGGW